MSHYPISEKTNTESYQVVSCAIHSDLELAIMQGTSLDIYYNNEVHETVKVIMQATDIVTRKNQGEFLMGVDKEGNLLNIRLDRIHTYSAITS